MQKISGCLTVDTGLTADPGLASSILTRSHDVVEIDHEIISMARGDQGQRLQN